jgi:peptidoglycan/xylan/chitin deacetylase (PgdA/CDA1 family)
VGVSAWFEPSVCIEHLGPTRLREFLRDQSSRGRRQARSDVLIRPSGFLRVKAEAVPALRGLTVGLRTLRHGYVRIRWLTRNLQRGATDRRDLAVTMPWIVVGLLANTLGWAQEQLAYSRTGSFTDVDGAGPSRAPLRRQTSTAGEKTVVLTFDDGPSDDTAGVLDVLSRYGVRATFFVLGERVAAQPDVVRSIAEAGHGLGIHGWSHTPFTEFDPGVLATELARTRALLGELTGAECHDVRPPKGIYDGELISNLAAQDFVTWLWTAEARDWSPEVTARKIAAKILRSLTPGGIILLHDGGGDRARTVRALPKIIEEAHARGFRFLTLDEVRADSPPVTA